MKGLDVSAPFRQLMERRLWPLALLLLAGLAAVPLLLAKDGEAPVPGPTAAAPAPAAAAAAAATAPVVSVADAATTEKSRTILGARKDPFRPAPAPRAKQADSGTGATMAPTSQTKEEPKSGTPAAGGGTSAPVAGPVAPVGLPTVPKRTYELYSLMVRFGDSTADELPLSNLKRLTSMPSVENPVVIYLGLMSDRRTGVFLVDGRAKVQGDGRCLPNAANCETVHLKVGETAFFDVEDESGAVQQYQLDVVRVARKRTSSPRALRSTASGGREAIRSRMSKVGRYRYSPHSGTVRRISAKQAKAAAARASRSAK